MKEWYNGYRFGNTSVYCPWNVINHCDNLCADLASLPENYWVNTSGNALVRRFIDKADKKTKDEIERLIAGETIVKEISLELAYSCQSIRKELPVAAPEGELDRCGHRSEVW
jgi:hypothetical protein